MLWLVCLCSLLWVEVECYCDSGLQVIVVFEYEFSLFGLFGECLVVVFLLQVQCVVGQFFGWLVSVLVQVGIELEMFFFEYGQCQYEVICCLVQGVVVVDCVVNVCEVICEVV